MKSATESSKGDVSSIWSRLRGFVGEAVVRLHGGTDDNSPLTGISIGDRELSGGFRKVLLWDYVPQGGRSWHQKWTSLAEQAGFAQTISQTQLLAKGLPLLEVQGVPVGHQGSTQPSAGSSPQTKIWR